VKVTVQQPSITTRSSRFDSSPDSSPLSTSATFLKTPTTNKLPFFSSSSKIASSAPEFSISGASSIDDAEESALYEQYLPLSHGRQSNPSPEMRKKIIEDWSQTQQRALPRSRSEANTIPIEQSQQQQQTATTTTSQIKPVKQIFFSFLYIYIYI
jgi:hypothetical protein